MKIIKAERFKAIKQPKKIRANKAYLMNLFFHKMAKGNNATRVFPALD